MRRNTSASSPPLVRMPGADQRPWAALGMSRMRWLEDVLGVNTTINEWCAINGVSRRTFYKMKAEGTGPKLMNAGGRILISPEATREWRHRCEQVASEQQHPSCLTPKQTGRDAA